VRLAYGQGYLQARSRLRQAGVSVGEKPELSTVFNQPIATQTVSRYFQRVYEDLNDLTADVQTTASSVLTTALTQGVNPREAADRLTGAVREIEQTRANTLARTRTIDVYTDASLDRYREAGVEAVAHGEFSDSDDSRVCPICESLDGDRIPINQIERQTFEFTPGPDEPDSLAGVYGKKPPIHPNGRCVILPIVD
jgi:phage putative head morphogenesis protein, SPP1 gp7 family